MWQAETCRSENVSSMATPAKSVHVLLRFAGLIEIRKPEPETYACCCRASKISNKHDLGGYLNSFSLQPG